MHNAQPVINVKVPGIFRPITFQHLNINGDNPLNLKGDNNMYLFKI